jgi:hypothetical protein
MPGVVGGIQRATLRATFFASCKGSSQGLASDMRQRDPVENLADKKVSLNGRQVFSYDLIVEPQTKQASRVAWSLELNDDPLD